MNSKIFIKTRYILSSNIRSIKLHCKCRALRCRVICIRSNFNSPLSPFISIESMASKGTPKKFYKKRLESTSSISHCRLCNCIADPGHSKNLFRKGNQTTLRNAEHIYGGELPQSNSLPHLICSPCERRLNNAIQLKRVITGTQRVLQRDVSAKRCVELSPSVPKPPAKVRSTGNSPRRSIDFGEQSNSPTAVTPMIVSTLKYLRLPRVD